MANTIGWYDFLKEFSGIKSYGEVGVQEGRSLTAVLDANQDMEHLALFDMWGREYGGTGRGNHNHIDGVIANFQVVRVDFEDGDSHKTLKKYFASNPNVHFDMFLVDGDHSAEGGKEDLVDVLGKADIILFHDTAHPAHLYLADVFKEVAEKWCADNKEYVWELRQEVECGVGIIRKADK